MKQEQLDYLRTGAELGKGMTLADVRKAPDSQILDLYLMMSRAVLTLVDEVERLQGVEEAEEGGPLKVGDKVEILAPAMHHREGDIGTVDGIDGEDQYPYLVRVATSARLKYARHELKKVG